MRLHERPDVRRVDGERGLRRERRPIPLWPLLGVMGFLSIGGVVGGVSFVVDRSGAGLGAKLSWLEQTPVSDFLLPGLFLLVVYGIGSAILMAGLTWRFPPACSAVSIACSGFTGHGPGRCSSGPSWSDGSSTSSRSSLNGPPCNRFSLRLES